AKALQGLKDKARRRMGSDAAAKRQRDVESEYTAEERAERDRLFRRMAEAFLDAPPPPATATVLAHSEMVPDTYVAIRGEYAKPGERVGPGFPGALSDGKDLQEPAIRPFVPQRRKALALWLARAGNPLFARAMVNRIWQGHFGRGIVATPNDFGRQGEAPTHPELLDWLATEFAQRGWSVKEMHRLIMLSSVYRSSSVADTESLRKDPENRYLGRMNRHRLDGDSLRDTVLAVSGALNLKMGGVGVIPPLTREEILAARMPYLWPANPDPSEHT